MMLITSAFSSIAVHLDMIEYPNRFTMQRCTPEAIAGMKAKFEEIDANLVIITISRPHREDVIVVLAEQPLREVDKDDYRYRYIPKQLHLDALRADRFTIIIKLLERLDGRAGDEVIVEM